jgi:hypothetical protein
MRLSGTFGGGQRTKSRRLLDKTSFGPKTVKAMWQYSTKQGSGAEIAQIINPDQNADIKWGRKTRPF